MKIFMEIEHIKTRGVMFWVKIIGLYFPHYRTVTTLIVLIKVVTVL